MDVAARTDGSEGPSAGVEVVDENDRLPVPSEVLADMAASASPPRAPGASAVGQRARQRPGGRRVSSSLLTSHSAGLTVSARRYGQVAVISLTGALDGSDPITSGESVEATLASAVASLAMRPSGLVVDVAAVEMSHFVIGLMGLLRRRCSRVAIPLVLAGLSPAGRELLVRARVDSLYPTVPDVPVALEALNQAASP